MLAEVPVEKLRKICDPATVNCQTSADVKPLDTIVGQDRAVKALQFGLEIQGFGFNTFVSGMPGTGKETAIKRFLEEVAKEKSGASDWCYVNNFKDPYCPQALRFPTGQAKQFQADMRQFIIHARRDIRQIFDSDEYAAKLEETIRALRYQKERLLGTLGERVKAKGFAIQSTPMGIATLPLKDGKPITDEDFLALDSGERQKLLEQQGKLQGLLNTAMRQIKALDKRTGQKLEALDRGVALFALTHLMEDLQEKYRDIPQVIVYLEAVRDDILENLTDFRKEQESETPIPFSSSEERRATIKKYEVNVLINNTSLQGAPVVMELNPTYHNLFGRIEKEAQFGMMVTDFTMIKAGTLHRANGGYLVLPIEDVLSNLFSWDSLKRALKNREIVIEEAGERLGFITAKSLCPAPIPLDVKVVLIGRPIFYHLLQNYDKDFGELFKVKADFDTQMDRTDEHVRHYVSFISNLCQEEGLRHLDRSALIKMIEHGSRMAEDQDKLSTEFGEIADVIREANFYATQDQADYTTAAHVEQAIEQRYHRSNLLQERITEMIRRGTRLIDVSGSKVGQVNGLSIINLGDTAFGQPSRITATVSLGKGQLIDIEREAELGGPIHTKGVMILAGYLSEKFAQNRPLALSAQLVFEQSYSGVEGDSASSAELYALLSSLANLPIRQGVAVTGSVNQKGQVQAIGGVNEKIEGFFDICQIIGLTGEQGVIIPMSNVKNLMLKEAVVAAVQEGMFHIWPVQHIDEGIEILTGTKGGEQYADGTFEAGTINDLVDQRLQMLAQTAKAFAGLPESEYEPTLTWADGHSL